jgi:hypothetical protein
MTQTLETDRLRSALDDITPKLDYALSEGPVSAYQHMGPFQELPRDLKRRGGICHATSWLLKESLFLNGIHTTPRATWGTVTVGDKQYVSHHVLLKTQGSNGRYVDPTYQQFYRYVGLAPHVAHQNPELTELYPDNDIAIISPNTTRFQEEFAENAHRIEQKLAKVGLAHGLLVGTTLEEKVVAYKQVWDFNTYQATPPSNPDLRDAVAQSATLMHRLETAVE